MIGKKTRFYSDALQVDACFYLPGSWSEAAERLKRKLAEQGKNFSEELRSAVRARMLREKIKPPPEEKLPARETARLPLDPNDCSANCEAHIAPSS